WAAKINRERLSSNREACTNNREKQCNNREVDSSFPHSLFASLRPRESQHQSRKLAVLRRRQRSLEGKCMAKEVNVIRGLEPKVSPGNPPKHSHSDCFAASC